MLHLADRAFFVFHSALILFNMVGWAFRRTRVLHLLTMGLTAFSWFVLGIWNGWGYCVCTEWHFQVRERLGYFDPETSYIQLLVGKTLGIDLDRNAADVAAVVVFVGILVAMAVTWTRELVRRFRTEQPASGPPASADSTGS